MDFCRFLFLPFLFVFQAADFRGRIPSLSRSFFCDFLFFAFYLGKFARVSDGDRAHKSVGPFDLVELIFDGLTQRQVVNVAQDEQGFDDLSGGLESLIQGVLSGVGVEPPEDVGGCVLIELYRGNQPEKIIPVFTNDSFIDRFVREDGPFVACLTFRLEDVEGLFADALDAWCEGKIHQMSQAKDSLGIPPS